MTPQRSQSALKRKQVRLRVLLGACVLIFAAGVFAIVQATTSEGSAPTKASPAQTKNQATPAVATKPGGKMTAEQRHVASRFIETALGRQHLAEAWNLATPELRTGVTRQQWLAGLMPIPPFPVDNLKSTGYEVVASAPTKVLVQVYLVPNPGTQYEATRYDMTLVRRHGVWKVSYLVPYAPQGIYSKNDG